MCSLCVNIAQIGWQNTLLVLSVYHLAIPIRLIYPFSVFTDQSFKPCVLLYLATQFCASQFYPYKQLLSSPGHSKLPISVVLTVQSLRPKSRNTQGVFASSPLPATPHLLQHGKCGIEFGHHGCGKKCEGKSCHRLLSPTKQ